VFPGDLLEHAYPDPNNPRELLARSEVRRRENYFERLEGELDKWNAGYPLVGVVKQCLENIPEERPTAEQLVRVLEGLKGDIEGTCGELTTMDAARQVKTAMALKKSREKADELTAKEEEMQQLQQQLEVQLLKYHFHPPPRPIQQFNYFKYRHLMSDMKQSCDKRMKLFIKRIFKCRYV
jgi:hypothetical protein